jgi:hypothetical protein
MSSSSTCDYSCRTCTTLVLCDMSQHKYKHDSYHYDAELLYATGKLVVKQFFIQYDHATISRL